MSKTIKNTNFNFPNQTEKYVGKVRDVYFISEGTMVMVTTDKISAFDVILPEAIPYKGQVLNEIALYFMEETKHIVKNWVLKTPHPNVIIGQKCVPFKVEIVVRGYLSGHAWREYKMGKRSLCGVSLPDGLKENDKLPNPIITPTTKADQGKHDEDISRNRIIMNGIVSHRDYSKLERIALKLFEKGTELADKRGLILVDTKYEFGKNVQGDIVLIDEVHTPDSSRYFVKEGYLERQKNGEPQKQLSKEFVREWLMENGFQGKDGQKIPHMTQEKINEISERYIELCEKITGKTFIKNSSQNLEKEIERAILENL